MTSSESLTLNGCAGLMVERCSRRNRARGFCQHPLSDTIVRKGTSGLCVFAEKNTCRHCLAAASTLHLSFVRFRSSHISFNLDRRAPDGLPFYVAKFLSRAALALDRQPSLSMTTKLLALSA